MTNIQIEVHSSFSHNFVYFSQVFYKWPLQHFPRLSEQFWEISENLKLGTSVPRWLISEFGHLPSFCHKFPLFLSSGLQMPDLQPFVVYHFCKIHVDVSTLCFTIKSYQQLKWMKDLISTLLNNISIKLKKLVTMIEELNWVSHLRKTYEQPITYNKSAKTPTALKDRATLPLTSSEDNR